MTNYKKITAICLLLLQVVYKSGAQALGFQPDENLQQTTMAALKAAYTVTPQYPNTAYITSPYSFPETNHPWYSEMTGSNTTSNSCAWPYFFKSIQDFVKVKIDKKCANPMAAFNYTFAFSVQSYSGSYLPGTPNISGAPGSVGALSGPTAFSLSISYDPAKGVQYKDIDVYKFSNAHKFKLVLTGITTTPAGTSVPQPVQLSQVPDCIVFETIVSTQRVDNVPVATIPAISSALSGTSLDLSWGYTCSSSSVGGLPSIKPMPKSVEYELEWTYVDNYLRVQGTYTIGNSFPTLPSSSPAIPYSFAGNATRVHLKTSAYSIPLIYEQGAIVYRIRTVSPDPLNYDQVIYGNWSLPESGTPISVGDPDLNSKAFIITNAYAQNLNWQYSINFAEEGKYKHVINYFDGALKSRQTQTKINSDNNYIVAVDHAFDFEGRAAITSLPTPILQSGLAYSPLVLVNPGTTRAVAAQDFDNRNGAQTSCAVPSGSSPATPALTSTGASLSLSELYYSANNPSLTGMSQFIPRAGGYPYIQTIFAPENSGKVIAQGGPGPKFQVYSGGAGHYTVNEYLLPEQTELDRVLGTEAGNYHFYPKTVTTDPNGQSSVTIQNKYGKPVISYLCGDPVTSTPSLVPLAGSTNTQTTTDDLLAGYEQTRIDRKVTAQNSFHLDLPSSPILNYSVSIKPFPICTSPNFGQGSGANQTNVQVKAKLAIDVTDDCGSAVPFAAPAQPAIITPAGTYSVALGYNSSLLPLTQGGTSLPLTYSTAANILPSGMAKGAYHYSKSLSFDRADIESVVNQFIDNNPSTYSNSPSANGCTFRTEEAFISGKVQGIQPCTLPAGSTGAITSYCDGLRNKMKAELWPGKKYGQYQPDLLGQYQSGSSNSIFTTIVVPNASNGSGSGNGGGGGNSSNLCTWAASIYNVAIDPINDPPIWSLTPNGVTQQLIIQCSKGCGHHVVLSNNGGSSSQPLWGTGPHTGPGCAIGNTGNTTNSCPPCQMVGSAYLSPDNDLTQCNVYWTCQYGHLHDPQIQVPRIWSGTTAYIPSSAFLIQGSGMPLMGPNYAAFNGPYTDDPSHHTSCNSYSTLRYQSVCLAALVNVNGIQVALNNIPPQYLIDHFNDDIAEALLPLHPEYCKLKFCSDGDFLAKITNANTFQQAQGQHIFELTDPATTPTTQSLNLGLVGQDPLYQNATNKAGMYASLTHLPGYTASLPATDPRSKDLSTLALEMAYCNAGSTLEFNECTAHLYQAQIASKTFINADVQQKYWESLRSLYLVSHNYQKQKAMDDVANNGCGPCNMDRLQPVGDPVSPTVIVTGANGVDNLAPNLLNLPAGDAAELDILNTYGNGSANTITTAGQINSLINNPPTTPPATFADNAGKRADFFLKPLKRSMAAAQYDALKALVKARLLLIPQQDITPDFIKNSFAAVANAPYNQPAIAAGPLCNAYLLDYNLVTIATEETDKYLCGSQALYNDVKDFANKLLPNAPFTISPAANAYENTIAALLGAPATGASTVSVAYSSTTNTGGTALWKYHLTYNGNSGIDVYLTPIASQAGAGVALPLAAGFTGGICANGQGVATSGYLANTTAVLLGGGNKFLLFCKDAVVMTPVVNPEMQRAVNAWDIRDAVTAFSADAAGYGYSTVYNHPCFEAALDNYLNYRLHKNYTFDRYEALMKGCAVSDYADFGRYTGSLLLTMSAANSGDYNALVAHLNALADPGALTTAPWNLGSDAIKLSYTEGGNRMVSIDLSRVRAEFVADAYADITAFCAQSFTGMYWLNANPVVAQDAAATVFIPNTQSTSPAFPATIPNLTAAAPVAVTMDQGSNTGLAYTKYVLTFAPGINAKQKSDAMAALEAYLNSAQPYTVVIYQRQLLRSGDYGSAAKANYLAAAGSTGITNHSQAATALMAAAVGPYVNNSGTATFTYDDPLCTGKLNDFCVYPSGAAIGSGHPLYTALSGYASLVGNGSTGASGTTVSGAYKRQMRKANGAYWFTYIAYAPTLASPHGYIVRNAYLLPPPGAGVSGYSIDMAGIRPAQCDASGDFYSFTVNVVSGGSTVPCKGYTDFAIANGGSRVQDVILYGSPDGQCYEVGDCEYQKLLAAIEEGKGQYYQYRQQLKDDYARKYEAFLMDPANITETLNLTRADNQYQYTLYFYDRAGNLMRTVPPQGVDNPANAPLATIKADRESLNPSLQAQKLIAYRKPSEYQYNSLNQLYRQSSPDGGVTQFYYDDKGRIAFSQNAKQAARSVGGIFVYSYSLYDEQGRPMETGEVAFPETYLSQPAIIQAMALHAPIADYYNDVVMAVRGSYTKRDVVYTVYDAPTLTAPVLANTDYKLSPQDNLRKRVAAVKYFGVLGTSDYDGWADNPDYAVHYSYDVAGNVKTLTHEIKKLGNVHQKYKRIDYDYDVLSGKVNVVSYNRGFPDQFYHRYGYDADNRVTKVETSNDGAIWATDATYDYYRHGPLAQVRLGDLSVQGIQYAYTLQGWLKAINGDLLNPNKDMGGNGMAATGPNSATDPVARDVVAHDLQYFNGDYAPAGTQAVEGMTGASTIGRPLYNGNIARQYTSIAGLSAMTAVGSPNDYYGLERTYEYDQLNRLTGAVNRGIDNVNGALVAAAATPANLYKSAYSYDGDGNILTLDRWDGGGGPAAGGTAQQMDKLQYGYTKNANGAPVAGADNNKHNQLQDVADLVGYNVAGVNDFKNPTATVAGTNTYQYDAIGNLIKDQREGLAITWNLYGKATTIKKGTGATTTYLNFGYDGSGNRVSKDVVTGSGATEQHNVEYYIRDAGGNILAVYKDVSAYGKLDAIRSINTAVLGGGTGKTGLAAAVGELGALYPSIPSMLLQVGRKEYREWAESLTASKSASYYLLGNEDFVVKLLTSDRRYLNALQDYSDAEGKGREEIAGAIASSDWAQIASFMSKVMGVPAAATATLKHFGEVMPEELSRRYWSGWGQEYDPADAAGSAAALDALIADEGAGEEAGLRLVDLMKEGAKDDMREAFLDSVVGDNAVFRASPLRAGDKTPFEEQLMSIIKDQGDREWLAGFLDQWPPAAQWVDDNIGVAQKLGTIYDNEPEVVIGSLLDEGGGDDVVNRVLSEEDGLSLTEYGAKLVGGSLISVSDLQTSLSAGVVSEDFGLSEHHVYGSSRLGVQYYDGGYGGASLPQNNALKNRWTYGSTAGPATFYNLNKGAVWYSYGYGDLVDKTAIVPWGNWDRTNTQSGTANANASLGNPSYYEAGRTLGWRQYEISDHLGNVLATILDRKTGSTNTNGQPLTHSYTDPNSGISYGLVYNFFLADVVSATDRYPGGFEMPGRTYEASQSNRFMYGNQNQQMDNDVYGKGNISVFKYRLEDNRLNRFWSVDPLAGKYPQYSQYSFSGNRLSDCIELEGMEPKNIIKRLGDPIYDDDGQPTGEMLVTGYCFTDAAAHLLSLVSGIPEKDILHVSVINGYGSIIPSYDPYKGGGAVTLPKMDEGDYSINLTDNFFTYNHGHYGKFDYYKNARAWLHLTAHEVGHIRDVKEIGHNTLTYLATFGAGYAKNTSHDGYWREKRADKGADEYNRFSDYVDSHVGQGRLENLFSNENNSQSYITKCINNWWCDYQEDISNNSKSTPTR